MMKKRLFVGFITVVLAFCMVACSSQKVSAEDQEIIDMVLEEFEKLTQIPRPSHHEEKVSEYLENWATERGFEPYRDEHNNVVFDVHATPGMEGLPRIALQGHMDMVFAHKDGENPDPLTTKVVMKNDGTYLTSDGNTSLGADDGIGVAMALCVAEGKIDHGPLRIICTTDEEDGMSGAMNMDPRFFQDINYLINIDSEDEGIVTISSAAGVTCEYKMEFSPCKQQKDSTMEIKLTGCSGGHSGLDIIKGGLNGAVVMAQILDELRNQGIDYEINSFTAGTASNAIVTSATAVICLDEEDITRTQEKITELSKNYSELGRKTDPDFKIETNLTKDKTDVMPKENQEALIDFITKLKNGVNSMSPDIEGLVESSSNLGIVRADTESISFSLLIRSCDEGKLEELMEGQKELASSLGYSVEQIITANPWPYKTDNTLLGDTKSVYKELFGKEIEQMAIHAGLECGTFAIYNKDLNIISIGPTLRNPHTVNERLELATVPKVWKLLKGILQKEYN